MSILVKVIALVGPVLLLLLTAIAGYSYSQIRFLSLPIPQALALFTVVLPLITGISTHGAYGLIKRSSTSDQHRITIPMTVVIGFQLIYETVVATLALTYLLPPDSLNCGLETRWQKLFANKNEKAMKAIQDAFNCCGFHNIRDRAWPFGGGLASKCGEIFGRSNGCLGQWRKAEQLDAGLLFLVAVVVFAIKVLSITSLFSNSWTEGRWVKRRSDQEARAEDNRATVRRVIEEGNVGDEYHDEPVGSGSAIEANENGHDQGPRVEPSTLLPLLGERNAW